MWINTVTMQYWELDSDARASVAGISLPANLTAESLAPFNIFPVTETTPTYNPLTQSVLPATPIQVSGIWTQQWTITTLPLEVAKANLLGALDVERISQQSVGLPYTFSDGTGTIQTRDPMLYPDMLNVNGYASAAIILQGQSVAQMPVGFIDAANTVHAMTPSQAMAMGIAVTGFIGSLYTAKQTILAAINALTADTVAAFDITQGW